MAESTVTTEVLKSANELYVLNSPEWRLLISAYEGVRELLRQGYLIRHERESWANYQRRLQQAYNFNYSSSVVDIFNFYLFKKPVKRDLSGLEKDNTWRTFERNADLMNDSLDEFLMEQGKYASIYGFVGILVDKADITFKTKEEELNAGVYPYVSSYHPPSILDWKFERDINGVPNLTYLKLLDDDDRVRIWTLDKWEVWKLPEKGDQSGQPKLESSGTNTLGEIPFVWLMNKKGRFWPIGVSDIHEVARIDVSIMKNLSDGEEVIDYAAFPMMRKPKQAALPGKDMPQKDEVGVTAILEFDPDRPESKPDWLEARVAEPIEAILKWIERKVAEVYRSTNIGGMAATEISTVAKSGVALKSEFQMLNATLVRKAILLEKAEKEIIRLWLKWEKKEDLFKDIKIERSRTYDVEDLAQDLDNALTATTLIRTPKFSAYIKKSIARAMLPALSDEQMKEVMDEIENQPTLPKPPTIPPTE